MRHKWVKAHWLGAVVLGLVGCQAAQPDLKPPPQPEELRVPPDDDARFNSPTKYPKDTMNQDQLKRPDPASGPVNPAAGRMPGMGGAGMSGMGRQ
jgi:hypothetical protein